MLSKTISTLLIGVGVVLVSPAVLAADGCNPGAPAESVAAEMAPWDFLIGHHQVDVRLWQDGTWTDPVATAEWNGWWGLEGHAIIDEWFGPANAEGLRNRGVNVRVWDEDAGRWRMTWQATRGAEAAIYESEVRDDGFMHMWQVSPPEEAETDAWFEITGDDTWIRVQKTRDETGAWINQFRLDAMRVPCDPE